MRKSPVIAAEMQELTIKVSGTPNAIQTLSNLLAAIEYNTSVGHSCVMGAFFDGDGADKIKLEGLPKNLGKEMAEACSNYGDDFLAEIGPDIAFSHNSQPADDDKKLVTRKTVFPEERVQSSLAASFLARAKETK